MFRQKLISISKNLATYFGASIIPMACNLVSNPWIAKNMSPEDYAISGYYLSFSSLISPVIIFYLAHYYIKEFFKRDAENRQKLFSIIAKALIWFSGLISIICFAGLFCYLKYFNSDLSFPIMPYLAMMVFALPLTGIYHLQLAEYRLNRDARSFFWLSIANSLATLALIIVFVVILKQGAYGKLLAPLIGNFLIFAYLLCKFYPIFKIKSSFSEFKHIINFCLPLAFSAMLGYFTHGFTTTYLESIGDNYEYGLYIVGNSIGSYIMVFSTAVGNTFQPDLYEAIAKKHWSRYLKFCFANIGLISLVVLAFIIVAPIAVSILTAGRYIASTTYAQIIAVSAITSSVYFLINSFSIATDHPKLYLITSIIGSVFIVCCMPHAVNNWGYYGGAWMSVISFLMFGLINAVLLILVNHHNFRRLAR